MSLASLPERALLVEISSQGADTREDNEIPRSARDDLVFAAHGTSKFVILKVKR